MLMMMMMMIMCCWHDGTAGHLLVYRVDDVCLCYSLCLFTADCYLLLYVSASLVLVVNQTLVVKTLKKCIFCKFFF